MSAIELDYGIGVFGGGDRPHVSLEGSAGAARQILSNLPRWPTRKYRSWGVATDSAGRGPWPLLFPDRNRVEHPGEVSHAMASYTSVFMISGEEVRNTRASLNNLGPDVCSSAVPPPALVADEAIEVGHRACRRGHKLGALRSDQ